MLNFASGFVDSETYKLHANHCVKKIILPTINRIVHTKCNAIWGYAHSKNALCAHFRIGRLFFLSRVLCESIWWIRLWIYRRNKSILYRRTFQEKNQKKHEKNTEHRTKQRPPVQRIEIIEMQTKETFAKGCSRYSCA